MDELDQLIAFALEQPHLHERWLPLADFLSERGDPLGEYIVLFFSKTIIDDALHAKMQEPAARWLARHAPWARAFHWSHTRGIELEIDDVGPLFVHAEELRAIRFPIRYQLPSGSLRETIVFRFDPAHAHLARARAWHERDHSLSPPWDNEYLYFGRITVWRVADRQVVFDSGEVEQRWVEQLEFRADGLYVGDQKVF
jgi:hypothetical protein